MKRLLLISGMISLLMMVSGCVKVVDWASCNFYQGYTVEFLVRPARRYMRSVIVYDQFDTAAIFHALWLSDSVRYIYAQMHALKNGMSKEQERIFLDAQLSENNRFISFYVLSKLNMPLDAPDPVWKIYLEIDGARYHPTDISWVENFPLEYQDIFFPLSHDYFAEDHRRFKVPYLVRFNAQDPQGTPLLSGDTRQVILHFRSTHKHVCLTWEFTALGSLIFTDAQERICNDCPGMEPKPKNKCGTFIRCKK